jgi:hypothetical protein
MLLFIPFLLCTVHLVWGGSEEDVIEQYPFCFFVQQNYPRIWDRGTNCMRHKELQNEVDGF